MTLASIDSNTLSFQRGITALIKFFQTDLNKNDIEAITKQFNKLNKDLSRLEFTDISSEQAIGKLKLLKSLERTFTTLIDQMNNDSKIESAQKELLNSVFSETQAHLDEIAEALEIFADEEAMDELEDYLDKSV